MGIPANRYDYVYWEDEYKLAFDDLSAEQRQFLKSDNGISDPTYSIAFKIKILGALSVGDGRKRPIPAAFPKSLS